jgi:Lrp/AsnC family transcriptional regulator, leucine-responsive regulatory protein
MKKPTQRVLDRTDLALLGILQNDGRISNVMLARRVNLSPTPCLNRVRYLQDAGYITGYRATLDPQALGLNVCAFVLVKLERNTRDQAEAFEQAILAIPEASEYYSTAGTHDYMLKIYARDLRAYQQIINDKIATLPFIDDVQSTIILSEHHLDGGLQSSL